jgi:hypothetical protein
MATWHQFEASQPEMAQAGWRLLSHPGFGFGYLATVRRDGGPRIHPINPVLAAGHLVAFIVPSPKLADLRRDGRYALHSSGAENVDDEFYLAGTTRLVGDAALRTASLAACHFAPGEDHVLVEFGIDTALWAHYSSPASWPPAYRKWSAG